LISRPRPQPGPGPGNQLPAWANFSPIIHGAIAAVQLDRTVHRVDREGYKPYACSLKP
jgi:hypothetical protein